MIRWDGTPRRFLSESSSSLPTFHTNSSSQWNTAFGTPGSTAAANSLSQPSPPLYTPSSMMSQDLAGYQDPSQQQPQFTMPTTMSSITQMQPVSQMPNYNSLAPNFVTSSMWRDTVASTYDTGSNKRRWDMDSSYFGDSSQSSKRPR